MLKKDVREKMKAGGFICTVCIFRPQGSSSDGSMMQNLTAVFVFML